MVAFSFFSPVYCIRLAIFFFEALTLPQCNGFKPGGALCACYWASEQSGCNAETSNRNFAFFRKFHVKFLFSIDFL